MTKIKNTGNCSFSLDTLQHPVVHKEIFDYLLVAQGAEELFVTLIVHCN